MAENSRAIGELKSRLVNGDMAVVVGAGVSLAATRNAKTASWAGLLEDGLQHAAQFGHPRLTETERAAVLSLLSADAIDFHLAAADIIESRLQAPDGAEWSRWLEASVGQHEVRDRKLLDAIHGLEVPILTTNYDSVLSSRPDGSSIPAVTWRNPRKWVEVLKGSADGVLHLHGWWDEPKSVVLGVRSYEAVLRNKAAQEIQAALGRFSTLLFIGYGGGLLDPNLGPLIEWLGHKDAPSHRHYVLLQTEAAQGFPARGSLYPLDFGPTLSFLPAFIEDLRRPSSAGTDGSRGRDAASVIADLDSFTEAHGVAVPEMVVLPEGTLIMGSSETEVGAMPNEQPAHKVEIACRFAVSRTPITFSEWDAYVRSVGGLVLPRDSGWGRGARPVIHVSWSDAQDYVRWLNSLPTVEGTYRLLSEAEWEYMARAGTTTPYWWGDTIVAGRANYDASERNQTTPVGSYEPNQFGLLDVLGNVWEWVQDTYSEDYTGAPTDGTAYECLDEPRRVVRGGCWYYDARFLRATARLGMEPDTRFNSIGFRVARTIRQPLVSGQSLAFISVNSGMALTCIEQEDVVQAPWAHLQQQHWAICDEEDECFRLKAYDGSMLTVLPPEHRNGSKVARSPRRSSRSQLWSAIPEGDGYILANAGSGKVLDVAGVAKSAGATIIQFSRHGNANQRWWVRKSGQS